MKNKKGFTLVELLVVIVLISLIMVLVVPQVQKVALQSKIKLCKSKVTLAEEALNLWVQDNYKCITTTDNCGMFSECSYNESSNEYTCKTTFSLLAKNNIVNYDKKIKDINYIINPINNGNMNDLIFNVSYNPVTKKVSTKTNNKVETEICSSNSINKPIDTKESTTKTTITTSGTTNPSNTTSTTIPTTSSTESKYNLIINNPDGKFNNNTISSEKYRTGTVVTIKLSFLTGYELDSYKCQNATCQQNGSELLVTIGTSDATVTINSREILACNSFATDSWAMIQKNIQNKNSSCYKVGDTKEITLQTGKKYNVRIANTTTPKNCEKTTFSQSGCGFVVEFENIITTRNIQMSTSEGGWPTTNIRKYLNNDFYNNKLPVELQNVIIETPIVSYTVNLHPDDEINHQPRQEKEITTDKIFLSSIKEVCGIYDQDNIQRTLDYYAGGNCMNSKLSKKIKNYYGDPDEWWLRTAEIEITPYLLTGFYYIKEDGSYNYVTGTNNFGLSPVFRIG